MWRAPPNDAPIPRKEFVSSRSDRVSFLIGSQIAGRGQVLRSFYPANLAFGRLTGARMGRRVRTDAWCVIEVAVRRVQRGRSGALFGPKSRD